MQFILSAIFIQYTPNQSADYCNPDPPGIERFVANAEGDWMSVVAMIGELENFFNTKYNIPVAVWSVDDRGLARRSWQRHRQRSWLMRHSWDICDSKFNSNLEKSHVMKLWMVRKLIMQHYMHTTHKGLTRHSLNWARDRGFKMAFAECSGAISTHILTNHSGAIVEKFIDYSDWNNGCNTASIIRGLPKAGHKGMSLTINHFIGSDGE